MHVCVSVNLKTVIDSSKLNTAKFTQQCENRKWVTRKKWQSTTNRTFFLGVIAKNDKVYSSFRFLLFWFGCFCVLSKNDTWSETVNMKNNQDYKIVKYLAYILQFSVVRKQSVSAFKGPRVWNLCCQKLNVVYVMESIILNIFLPIMIEKKSK